MASKDSPRNTTLAVALDATGEQEQMLLHRIAQGDTAAFWTLWERSTSTNLSSHCLRWMGGNREDAEDALSSASVRALQYLPLHAHKIKNVKAWLTRLLYNHCMTLQKARRRHLHYLQSTERVENAAERALRSPQMPAEEALLLDERSRYIRHGIQTLPPRLREPAILYFYGDMSQQDWRHLVDGTALILPSFCPHSLISLGTQIDSDRT